MKKIAAITFILLALTGCKSLDSVRAKQPVDAGKTNKTVESFSACVAVKWAGNGTAITSLPLANGISILVPQAQGGYDVVLDITRTDHGSSYVLYERIPSLTSASYENSVKSCK